MMLFMRFALVLPSIVIGLLAAIFTSPAPGADNDIEALKAQFQAQFDLLSKRVETLEAENARLKSQATATSSSAAATPEITSLKRRVAGLETAANSASLVEKEAAKHEAVNAEKIKVLELSLQAGATETRDVFRSEGGLFDPVKFYDLAKPFEFHGYLRSGFGMNGEGGKMEAFKAPGAGAKYRLGNEADTYGELTLVNNWLRLDDPTKSPYVRSQVTLSYSTGENFSYESLNNQAQGNDFALREAFVQAGNVIEGSPDIKFWAGQRYYQRHDIHINDFYYLDMSGYGGGVEDVALGGFGKLSLAWLGGSVDHYQTDKGNASKQNIDLRISDIKAPLGKLALWLDYANTRGGDVHNVTNADGSPLTIQGASGWAAGIIHRTEEKKFLGGYNEFAVQYGKGAAYNFASTLDSSGPDLGDASRFRVLDSFTIQPSSKFAVQVVGLYEDTSYGGPNSRVKWASLGARPVYFFNDRFSIALEAGVDWVRSEPLDTSGQLWKITLAPQISRGGEFFSRPVIRPFVTYAGWSDGFKGQVGGLPYQNSTSGLSYGLQVEAWW